MKKQKSLVETEESAQETAEETKANLDGETNGWEEEVTPVVDEPEGSLAESQPEEKVEVVSIGRSKPRAKMVESDREAVVSIETTLRFELPLRAFDHVTKDKTDVLLNRAREEWRNKIGDLKREEVSIEGL